MELNFKNRQIDGIEIDITYKCNFKCSNCNRSCDVINSNEEMSINQIESFIKETIIKNKIWKYIRLIGGEPTLHSKFYDILNLIIDYKKVYNPKLEIHMTTNYISSETKSIVNSEIVKNNIKVYISDKSNERIDSFHKFYIAPVDVDYFKNDIFEDGCILYESCGVGLNLYGYYPCPIAANIDRILGLDVGYKSIPEDNDDMKHICKELCKYCGHYKNNRLQKENEPPIILHESKFSNSWKKTLENYFTNKPKLTKIYTIK
jgi:hypothetical protein